MAEYIFKTDQSIMSCQTCPFVRRVQMSTRCPLCEGAERRYGTCPLVEVPTHGDLKDFNDIVSIFDKVIYDVDDDTNALLADLLVKIGYAPTVIGAKDDCDCTAPDCLDCEGNDECNSIGIERLWEDKDKNE